VQVYSPIHYTVALIALPTGYTARRQAAILPQRVSKINHTEFAAWTMHFRGETETKEMHFQSKPYI
jgi:hypothetical protein